jgi:hypothetical protein
MLARSLAFVALLICASCSDDSSSGEAGGGTSPTGGSPGTGGAGAAGAGSDGGAGGLATGGSGGELASGGGAEGGTTNTGGSGGGGEGCGDADGTYTGSYSWTFQYNDTTTICTGELTVIVDGEDISGEGHCVFDVGNTEWDSTMTGTRSPGSGAAEGSFTPGVGLSLGSTTWAGQLTCDGGFILEGELAPKQRGGNLTEGDFSVERE